VVRVFPGRPRHPEAVDVYHKAYRQDFDSIAALVVGSVEDLPAMSLGDITIEAMRAAFAHYATPPEAASIQRC